MQFYDGHHSGLEQLYLRGHGRDITDKHVCVSVALPACQPCPVDKFVFPERVQYQGVVPAVFVLSVLPGKRYLIA
jgi:hypothetical protein